MVTIIIKNTIEQTKILIDFNLQDGALAFPSVEINTEGDIDFNSLIVKLTELIEYNRKLEIEFVDANELVITSPKIKLVQSTLLEIYNEFNNKLEIETPEATENIAIASETDTQV